MATEIDDILDNMFLLVVTAFPDEMEKYNKVDFSVLENKLRGLLPKLPDIKSPGFTMLRQATMILNRSEVEDVYCLLAKGISEKKSQVETPENLSGYGLSYPVRIYAAFDMRDIEPKDRKRFLGEVSEVSCDEETLSDCIRIKGKELTSWENLLKCKTSDLNWFFECKTSELEK